MPQNPRPSRSLFGDRARLHALVRRLTAGKKARAPKLRLEGLEDRAVPATPVADGPNVFAGASGPFRTVGTPPDFISTFTFQDPRIDVGNSNEAGPRTAAFPDGSFVMVWTQSGGSPDIRAQRFAANGDPAGPVIPVSPGGPSESQPDVAAMPGGGFAVVWVQDDGSGSSDLMVAVYGNPASPSPTATQTLANAGTVAEAVPTIAFLGGAGNPFLVTWEVAGGPDTDVYGQRVQADGTLVDPSPVLLVGTADNFDPFTNPTPHAAAAVGNGGFALTWVEGGNVKVRRFDAALAGGPVQTLDQGLLVDRSPDVAALANGRFVAVWEATNGGPSDLWAQVFTPAGAKAGPAVPLTAAIPSSEFEPSVSGLADGGFAVSWLGNNGMNSTLDVRFQTFNADASPRLPTATSVTITGFTPNPGGAAINEKDQAVTALPDGRILVSWVDPEPDTVDPRPSGDDILYQAFDPGTGAPLPVSDMATSITLPTRVGLFDTNGTETLDLILVQGLSDFGHSLQVGYQDTAFNFDPGPYLDSAWVIERGHSAAEEALLDALVADPANAHIVINLSGIPDDFNFTVVATSGEAPTTRTSIGRMIDVHFVSNLPPALTLTSGGITYTENDPAAAIDAGATVTDTEHNWDGGSVKAQITGNPSAADRLSILTTTDISLSALAVLYDADGPGGSPAVQVGTASAASVTGNTALTVTLNASADDAAVQALVRAFAYDNTSDAPSTLQRTVTFTVADDADAVTGTRTVDVTATNDAPALDDTKTPVFSAVNEDAGVPFGLGLGTPVSSLIDLDPPAGGLDNATDPDGTPAIGIALVGTAGNGSWFYTFDGGFNWITVGAVSDTGALLLAADPDNNSRLYFRPAADFNGTVTAALTFRAWDTTYGSSGDNGVNLEGLGPVDATAFSAETDTVDVTVNAVADAVTDAPTTAEDAAATVNVLGNDDFEDPARQLTSFTQGTHGTVTRDDNGTPGDLTDDKLVYTPALDYNGTDSFTYTVTAGGVTETGTVNVTLTAVADIVAEDIFTGEDSGANDIDVFQADTFEDPARQLTSFTQGAHGTVTRFTNGTPGNLADDRLIYTPDPDYNGTDTFTYTVTPPNGTAETATETVHINAVADIAADTVTVDEDSGANALDLLANDTFEDSGRAITAVGSAMNGTTAIADNGTPGDPTDDFVTYTPNAGYVGPDSFTYTVTAGGVTEQATVTVTVAAVNDAPALANVDGHTTSATEQTSTLLDGSATVSDVELDAANNYAGASLTVARQGGASAQDGFGFDTTGAAFTVSGGNLQSGGLTFATFTVVSGTLTVSFTSSGTPATTALVNDVLQHITYQNTSDDPPAQVLLDYTFNDGNAGAQGKGGARSDIDTLTVNVAAVNDAPTLSVDAAAAYGGTPAAPVTLAPAAAVTDPDDANLSGATVSATDFVTGDTLAVNLPTTGGVIDGTAITVSYNSTTGVLTLSGTDTKAHYQSALRAVRYSSTSADPTVGGTDTDRTVAWTVTDLQAPSNSPTTTVTLDVLGPAVSIGMPSVAYAKSGTSVTYTVTYTDPHFDKSTLKSADITLDRTGTANATTVSVSAGSGSTRTVTVSGITGDGTLGITIAAGTATDTFGNPAAGPATSTTFVVDNTKPAVAAGAPSASLTKGGPVTFTLTYTDANFGDSSALTGAGITLNKTGTANGTVSVDAGTGSTRTVTISGITGDGTLGITVKAGTAVDLAGNTATASAASTTFEVDNTGPAVTITANPPTTTVKGPVSWKVSVADPHPGTFSLTSGDIVLVGSTATLTATSVVVSGPVAGVYTVTVDDIRGGGGTLKVKVKSGVAADSLGNLSAEKLGPGVTVTAPRKPTLTQTVPPAYVFPGATQAYTITATNPATGTQTLTGAYLIVQVPTWATFQPGLSTAGWTRVAGTGPVRYRLDLGDMAPGAKKTVSFVITVAPGAPAGTSLPLVSKLMDVNTPAASYLATVTTTTRVGVQR